MAIVQSGSFTSDGTAKTLDIRSDLDYMNVYNYTQAATQQTPGRGVQFRWQRGMAAGTGLEWAKTAGADDVALVTLTSGGFTLFDASNTALEAGVTGTTITKADPPVCSATSHGYSDGDIVQLSNLTDSEQLATVDWEIDNTATDTFELKWMDTNTGNFTQASAFTSRRVPVFANYLPAGVIITALSTGATTGVTLSVAAATVGFAVDQIVRFTMPAVWGPSSLDEQTAKITAINTSTNVLTLDIDSSAATSFAWPAASAMPFTFAQLIPVGIDSATSITDRTRNTATIGIKLAAGAQAPAGSTSDVIYWEAGKSDLVQTS